jgi:hypothetical protein
MSRVAAFGRFLYEFVVGDDIWLALVVVAALALTKAFPSVGGGAFWIVPIAVICVLAVSVGRVARRATP